MQSLKSLLGEEKNPAPQVYQQSLTKQACYSYCKALMVCDVGNHQE